MNKTKKEIEGKYYWTAVFKPYIGLQEPHRSKGLAEIHLDGENRSIVSVITSIFPEDEPDKLMAVIVFEGYFETKEEGVLKEGDTLFLNYVKRIGIGYAAAGTKPAGHYSYPVEKVERDNDGQIKLIQVSLITEKTKGPINFGRIYE